jgi:hypothetical protein|tara:strand:+ start:721 stop:915 length:195 start_codon:yes stop_codon:yes gene_type:complete
MKPGDLVVLSSRKTRKGMSYEEKIGIVISTDDHGIVKANFEGQDIYFNNFELVTISESRGLSKT